MMTLLHPYGLIQICFFRVWLLNLNPDTSTGLSFDQVCEVTCPGQNTTDLLWQM